MGDPLPTGEAARQDIARLPEVAKGALIKGGFEIFEVNPSSVATVMEALRGTGLKVEWANDLSEADRAAIANEKVPGTEVALKRNTAGHPKIYDKLMTHDAIEAVNEWGESFSKLEEGAGARPIMGSVGLHLSMLYKDYSSQEPGSPIYAGFTDGVDVRKGEQTMVRIRTFTPTSDGKRVTIEITPGKITLVPQFNPVYDPELGRNDEREGVISARTYLPIVPDITADQLQPRFDITPPVVIHAPQA